MKPYCFFWVVKTPLHWIVSHGEGDWVGVGEMHAICYPLCAPSRSSFTHARNFEKVRLNYQARYRSTSWEDAKKYVPLLPEGVKPNIRLTFPLGSWHYAPLASLHGRCMPAPGWYSHVERFLAEIINQEVAQRGGRLRSRGNRTLPPE